MNILVLMQMTLRLSHASHVVRARITDKPDHSAEVSIAHVIITIAQYNSSLIILKF